MLATQLIILAALWPKSTPPKPVGIGSALPATDVSQNRLRLRTQEILRNLPPSPTMHFGPHLPLTMQGTGSAVPKSLVQRGHAYCDVESQYRPGFLGIVSRGALQSQTRFSLEDHQHPPPSLSETSAILQNPMHAHDTTSTVRAADS
jgi:hypothetical protein